MYGPCTFNEAVRSNKTVGTDQALYLTPACFLNFCLETMSPIDNEDLIDYEDEENVPTATAASTANGVVAGADGDDKDKKNFSGIHSTGFRLVSLSGKICYPYII